MSCWEGGREGGSVLSSDHEKMEDAFLRCMKSAVMIHRA